MRGSLFVFFFLVRGLDLSRGVLGDGLGALRDGVLGQLTGEDEPDSGLDLPGGDGRLLAVPGELGGLGGDLLEDVVDEGVHDRHGLGGDTGVGVNLLENLVDVDLVGLDLRLLLLGAGDSLLHGLLGGLLVSFLRWHLDGFFLVGTAVVRELVRFSERASLTLAHLYWAPSLRLISPAKPKSRQKNAKPKFTLLKNQGEKKTRATSKRKRGNVHTLRRGKTLFRSPRFFRFS